MEKNNIEIQIENLKTQTVLLEKLLKMNKQYETKYGPIDQNIPKPSIVPKKNNFASMYHRRTIC